MASVSDEATPTQGDVVESSPSENQLSADTEEVKQVDTSQTTQSDEDKTEPVVEEEQLLTSTSPIEPEAESQPYTTTTSTPSDSQEKENKVTSNSSEEVNKENIDNKPKKQESSTTKSRSVNFSSTVDEKEIPKSRSTNSSTNRSSYSSSKSSNRPADFIDALVESYKLETSGNRSPIKEDKKYVPKTNRSRLNPNWREHRTRHLMNKLEELSLWDREEELKAAQAQSLREQKWEQIQDRQRNHDLCLNLMRQRHESEMESAVVLDRGASIVNDENTSATIARAMNITSPANILQYDLPTPPHSLKRRVKQEEDPTTEFKTPIGRYRQFENNMNNKLEKINQKLQPDHEIMRAYSPYRTSIPPTAVPLFSETYSALLAVPDTYSTNKYNQYHYGVASHLHQSQHAPSPDYETRLRSYSNRDVRVPLKEQANDYGYHDDDNNTDEYNRSNLHDDDRYTKYHSNPIEHDYYTKYRSKPLDEDRYTKYRSNPIDDNYYSKHRSTLDDDYYPKHRSTLDDDYHPKHRSTLDDDDYPSKYRSNLDDDDLPLKYRSTPVDDDYYTKYRSTLSSGLDYSPPRRTTALASPTASALYDYSTVANTPREFSFLHSRLPASNSIHLRSLNDDLNAITRFSTEASKKILNNIGDSPIDSFTKPRSSSSTPSTRHVNFSNQDNDEENFSYKDSSRNYSSKTTYQPVEIISLSSTR